MQQNITNQQHTKDKEGRSRSRWGMRGLSFPSFSRSRSSDSQDGAGQEAEPSARRRGSGKMSFWKRRSANITEYDPTYRVVYLGNVLTGWAKGEGCVDKPLSTLWRNHISSDKPDIVMKVTVVNSGLRAVTKEHGLTEYWANRITYSVAHPSYPKVFCWIYRHEGRKMKQELRCHAVLCPREEKAREMATQLQNRLHQALVDFKKEKISRQNARLSLANCIHENPSMPYRKLLLQAGTNNYKPPIERSKSAPKLTSIEEAELEEEEFDGEEEDTAELRHHIVEVHGDPPTQRQQPEARPRVPPIPSFNLQHPFLVEESEDEEVDEDEDEITDYLGGGEVDSAQSSSPASQGRSSSICSNQDSSPLHRGDADSLSSSSDQFDSGHAEEGLGKLKVSEQDTISDESGYSEEPISGRDVTVVRVNGDHYDTPGGPTAVNSEHKLSIELHPSTEFNSPPLNSQSISVGPQTPVIRVSGSAESVSVGPQTPVRRVSGPTESRETLPVMLGLYQPRSQSPSPLIQTPSPSPLIKTPSPRGPDFSVKSVLLSEFSSSEKLRYIAKGSIKTGKPNLVLNRQEFCINI